MTQLGAVVSGRNVKPTSFPFCRYFLSGIANEPFDNQPSNYRTYRFIVEVIQEVTNKPKADAEADFQDAVDAVLDRLNANWQLSGNCDDMVIDPGSVLYQEPSWGPSLILPISVSVKTMIN